ncbi:MAG: acylphosphatase [Candidatus Woesearchaeota archaeon]
MNDKYTYHIIVEGRVQGVGFRYFTMTKALKYHIKGSVQNIKNSVEIYCQGEKETINKFINDIRKGPQLSLITNFIINEVKIQDFKDFKIL